MFIDVSRLVVRTSDLSIVGLVLDGPTARKKQQQQQIRQGRAIQCLFFRLVLCVSFRSCCRLRGAHTGRDPQDSSTNGA